MKRIFDKLITPQSFLATFATLIAPAETAERYRKYKDESVFVCTTRYDAERANDHLHNFVDVVRKLRAKPLPFPEGVKCENDTVNFRSN